MAGDLYPGQATVLNTRPARQAGALSDLLREAGYDVVEAPATRVVPLGTGDARRAAEALRSGQYDWVVVPSPNAARFLVEACGGAPLPGHAARVLCGPGTARVLRAAGWTVETVLVDFSGAAAAGYLRACGPRAVLVPKAQDGGEEIALELRAGGAVVDEVHLYRTEAVSPGDLQPAAALLAGHRIDAVVLASPSALLALTAGLRALGQDPLRLLASTALVCIGETTAAVIRGEGLAVAAIADQPSPAALVDAVERGLKVPA